MLVFVGMVAVLSLVAGVFLYCLFDLPKSSKKELIANYQSRQKELETLARFYQALVPDTLQVRILFKKKDRIDLMICRSPQSLPLHTYFQGWDLDPSRPQDPPTYPVLDPKELTFPEALALLHWNEAAIKKIRTMLDKAGCIGITNGEPVVIDFRYSDLGMYSYNLFGNPITDKARYNDSCRYILYNEHVVLEYGGGAIGPQCFPDARD